MKVEHNLQLDEQKVSKDYQGLENRIMALKALLDERVYSKPTLDVKRFDSLESKLHGMKYNLKEVTYMV